MLTATDIFAGAGGSSTGIGQVPGVQVVLAANHWRLAVDVHAANHPATDHACVDLHMEDPRNFPRTDLLWASPECFTAGHLVTTARGQVPIENVIMGDLVLTHKGRWRKVVRTQSREARTVTVRGQGHVGIETTANHRFWLRERGGAPDWIAPLDAGPARTYWATPVSAEALPLPIAPPPASAFGSDPALAWWLVGRWLGDGSLSSGRNHAVELSCGFHEAAELRDVLAATGARWSEFTKRTATTFYLGDQAAHDSTGSRCRPTRSPCPSSTDAHCWLATTPPTAT